MVKGVDGQDIFYDDQDRHYFLKLLSKIQKNYKCETYAYCLMTNHVHMVEKIQNEVFAIAMQSLLISYVHYFNSKYERTGTLVQGRFKSKNVENQEYFLKVCRYVHRNPEKAKIARTENYKWSSYNEYLGKERIINKSILLHYFNNDVKEFAKYTITSQGTDDIDNFAEYEFVSRLSDNQLKQMIVEKFAIDDSTKIKKFFKIENKKKLDKIIKEIKDIKGTNATQVSRVMGINRNYIKLIWK